MGWSAADGLVADGVWSRATYPESAKCLGFVQDVGDGQ